MSGIPFAFDAPIVFFEKADADAGRQKRIAGIISTEQRDRQGEVILQRGLDFSDFLQYGWFNDNHSKAATDIVGYPERVQSFAKGAQLPDGSQAKTNLTWAEGYLLDSPKGNSFWELGKALQKSGRRLGYSIEGAVEKRTGPDRKTIAKARVKHVAVTHVPVNADSRLEILAKSLAAMEEQGPDADLEKTLTSGAVSNSVPRGMPITGAGAGQILAGQSLESDVPQKRKKQEDFEKSDLSVADAVTYIRAQTGVSEEMAHKVLATTQNLKRAGKL